MRLLELLDRLARLPERLSAMEKQQEKIMHGIEDVKNDLTAILDGLVKVTQIISDQNAKLVALGEEPANVEAAFELAETIKAKIADLTAPAPAPEPPVAEPPVVGPPAPS